jgi:outer membrane receptor protein involved in Fe transport
MRGFRVSLGVNNLFDQRLQVTDATGATPLSFQPDLLDPLGRSVRLSIRKQFF